MSVFDSFKKDNGIDQKDEKKGQSTYASFLRDNDVQDRRSWEAEKEWERYQATQGAVKEAQGLSWMPGVGTEDAGKQQYAKAIDRSIAYQKAEDDARAAALEGGQQAKEQAAAMQTDIDAAKGTLDDTKSKQSGEAWLEMIGKGVDGAWAGMTGTSAPITPYSNSYQGQIDDQTKQVEELEGQQRDLMFQYYSSLFAAKDFEKNSQKPQTAENGEDMDYIGGMVGGGIHQPGQMSEDEVAIYNYLYNTQGAQAAKEFVDFLGTDLDARWRLSKEQAAADYAKKDPVGASIGSVLLSPLKVGGYLMQVGDYLADGEIDQNATYNLASYQSNAIRSTVGGMIDDAAGSGFWGGAAKLGYDTTMSIGDFLLDTAISGGSKTLSLAIMGSGAATDTVIQAKDNGLSDGQAFWLGAIAGGAEIAMENIGMDALFDAAFRKSKGTLMYILKNALSEGGEEVGTELINTIADTIIAGDKSQMQRAIDAYMAAGKPESEAFGLWIRDKAVEIGVSFAGGAVSGGVMGGGMAAIDATQVNALAAKIDKGLVYVDLGDVVAQGLELDPASNGYALAQMIEAQMEAGETISNKDVARLMLINETVQGGGQSTEEPVVDDDGDTAPSPASPAPEGGTLSKGELTPQSLRDSSPWKGS